jgi:hypothetical protein
MTAGAGRAAIAREGPIVGWRSLREAQRYPRYRAFMAERWLTPSEPPTRITTEAERAEILVDLLHLVDALPAPPRRPLGAPTFKELCERG